MDEKKEKMAFSALSLGSFFLHLPSTSEKKCRVGGGEGGEGGCNFSLNCTPALLRRVYEEQGTVCPRSSDLFYIISYYI